MPARPSRIVATVLIGAAFVAGCGGGDTEDAAVETAPQGEVDPFASPALSEGEVDWGRKQLAIDESLIVPSDDVEAARWVRDDVSIYANGYVTCGGLFDFDSPSFDPSPESVFTASYAVTEDARQTSERAAWVALRGCRDGMMDYPFPIPEVKHLQRLP